MIRSRRRCYNLPDTTCEYAYALSAETRLYGVNVYITLGRRAVTAPSAAEPLREETPSAPIHQPIRSTGRRQLENCRMK